MKWNRTEEIAAQDVVIEAEKFGIKFAREIGRNDKDGDHKVIVYELENGSQVATTNGDSIWDTQPEYLEILAAEDIDRVY